jgi:hypothetical protein
VIKGGATQTVVMISGGPVTEPITLPSPQPTQISPAGEEVKESASSLSEEILNALSKVTEWINNPAPPQMTPAAEAIKPLISGFGGLINNLPDGGLTLQCENLQPPSAEPNFVQDLNELTCYLIDILHELQEGSSTENLGEVAPIVQVQNDSDQVLSKIENIMSIRD